MFKKISIGTRLTGFNLLIILISTICIAFIGSKLLKEEMRRLATERQEANIRVAWEMLKQTGSDFQIIGNELYAGEKRLNGANSIVDTINSLVGGTATIFMGDTRVSTNELKGDGSRAIGTQLARGAIYDTVFKDGKSYRGEADIFGTTYFTAYDPIVSSSGNVVGMLYVGIEKDQFFNSVSEITSTIIYIVIGFGALLCSIIFFLSRHFISIPLIEASRVIKDIARGNLKFDLFIAEGDEIDELYNSFHIMQLKLTEVIANIRSGAAEVAISTDQVKQDNTNLSQRTQEQASSLEEAAANLEDITNTVRKNAESADQAKQLAREASDKAEKGGKIASQAIVAMHDINEASKQIADIISVIDDIAFKTNLLALNAAVEAARAGEQGRGFAVVASEVRSLAGHSAAAAKEIKELIGDSVAKVADGTKLVNQSGQTLEDIVLSVKKVSDVVAEIATTSHEQSESITQVDKALSHMDEMTQKNALLVEDTAVASEIMSEQAVSLSTSVDFFILKTSVEMKVRQEIMGANHKPDNGLYKDNNKQAPLTLENDFLPHVR